MCVCVTASARTQDSQFPAGAPRKAGPESTQVAAANAHVVGQSDGLRESAEKLEAEVRRMEEHAGQMAQVITLKIPTNIIF